MSRSGYSVKILLFFIFILFAINLQAIDAQTIDPIEPNATKPTYDELKEDYVELKDLFTEKENIFRIELYSNNFELNEIMDNNPITYFYYDDFKIIKPYPYDFKTVKLHNPAYGENETCLGQFVDNFENMNYVSVNQSIERNSTLNALELNYLVGGYEDLSTYTEFEESGNRIMFNSNYNVSLSFIRNVDSRLYKDFGVGYFDDFEYEFIFHYNSSLFADLAKVWFLISNVTTNPYAQYVNKDRNLAIVFSKYSGNRKIDVIESKSDGTQNFLTSNTLADSTNYYCLFGKNSSYWWLKIYTDEDRTNLFQKIELALDESSANYRYLMIASLDSNNAQEGRIEISYILCCDFGYELSGYCITTNYLDQVNGSSLVDMWNSTIPGSTGITVQYSNDNVTWVNNQGVAGYNSITSGFLSIDLREIFNSTGFFKMINMTSSGTDTPRIYQSRLITTQGSCSATVEDYSPMIFGLMIGLLFGFGIILKRD